MLIFSFPAISRRYLMISKEANLLALLGRLLSLPFPTKQQALLQKNMYFCVRPIDISMSILIILIPFLKSITAFGISFTYKYTCALFEDFCP